MALVPILKKIDIEPLLKKYNISLTYLKRIELPFSNLLYFTSHCELKKLDSNGKSWSLYLYKNSDLDFIHGIDDIAYLDDQPRRVARYNQSVFVEFLNELQSLELSPDFSDELQLALYPGILDCKSFYLNNVRYNNQSVVSEVSSADTRPISAAIFLPSAEDAKQGHLNSFMLIQQPDDTVQVLEIHSLLQIYNPEEPKKPCLPYRS